MIETPQIVETAAQPIAFIPVYVARDEIQKAMAEGLNELSEVLARQEIIPTGAWFTRYLRRPAEDFDFDICFPVATTLVPEGRVLFGQLRAAIVARTIYEGPYSGLPAAWGELHRWIQESGEAPEAGFWQRCLAGQDSGMSAARFRTELNQPLKRRG